LPNLYLKDWHSSETITLQITVYSDIQPRYLVLVHTPVKRREIYKDHMITSAIPGKLMEHPLRVTPYTATDTYHISTPTAMATLNPGPELREIGELAVWSVSSAKPGNGVNLLRDGREDTYWQSDGSQPHLVSIQFQETMEISYIAIYMDWKLDESYTPNQISVRYGDSFTDLKELKVVQMHEPTGWIFVGLPLDKEDRGGSIRAYVLQLAVVSNHQNGRDTHIRQVKVYGPRQDPMKILGRETGFTSLKFNEYALCR
jgi:anaphase-promoting complex subunit 10